MYLLSFDFAVLSLLYQKRPHFSLVPPCSVYRRPEPASLCSSPCLNFTPLLQQVLSCLAAANLLTWPLFQSSPVSELPSSVTHTPTQVCWMPRSLFYSQEVEAWVSSGLSCLTKGTGKKYCMGLPGDMGGGGGSAWTFSSRQKPSASWLSGKGNLWGSSSVAAACPFEPSSLQMDKEEMNKH